jgi:hypothetical protein
MKVRKLIELLQKLSPDAIVWVSEPFTPPIKIGKVKIAEGWGNQKHKWLPVNGEDIILSE